MRWEASIPLSLRSGRVSACSATSGNSELNEPIPQELESIKMDDTSWLKTQLFNFLGLLIKVVYSERFNFYFLGFWASKDMDERGKFLRLNAVSFLRKAPQLPSSNNVVGKGPVSKLILTWQREEL